jgi:hypothetical protein
VFTGCLDVIKFVFKFISASLYLCEPDAKLVSLSPPHQGCQMVYFQTNNPNLGKFLRALV